MKSPYWKEDNFMKDKIIWWIQFIINELFMLWLMFYLWNKFASETVDINSGYSILLAFILIAIALILGYMLTVKFENKNEHVMKSKIIWWIQFSINEVFMLNVYSHISNFYGYDGSWSLLLDIVLIIVALILGYALTVKFENNSD